MFVWSIRIPRSRSSWSSKKPRGQRWRCFPSLRPGLEGCHQCSAKDGCSSRGSSGGSPAGCYPSGAQAKTHQSRGVHGKPEAVWRNYPVPAPGLANRKSLPEIVRKKLGIVEEARIGHLLCQHMNLGALNVRGTSWPTAAHMAASCSWSHQWFGRTHGCHWNALMV